MNPQQGRGLIRLVSLLLLVLGCQAVAATEERARYDGQKVVTVTVSSPDQLNRVLAIVNDVWAEAAGIGSFEVRVSPDQLTALEQAGIPYQVVIEDLQAVVDLERESLARSSSQPNGDWFSNFRTNDEINDVLQYFVSTYPDLTYAGTIGQSLEGRDLWAIRITGPDTPENPRDARPAFVINGTQHAREWIAPMTVVYIANALLSQYNIDPRIQAIVNAVDFYIVPVVNPDGYVYTWTTERYWRKNRSINEGSSCRGVDLNRNWSVAWSGEGGSGNPCSDTYYGTAPFSEPETAAMRDLELFFGDRFKGSIDFHSFGRLVLEPWQYTVTPPPDAAYFQELGELVSDGIYSVNQLRYQAGQGSRILYIASGTAHDFGYGALNATSIGIELRGNDFVLPPEQIVPTGAENLEGTLRLIERLFLQ